jgi:PAS domain S-box-containing protein
MSWHVIPYVVPLVAAASISLGLALYIWRHRHAPGTFFFLLILLSIAEWTVSYIFQMVNTEAGNIIFWSKMKYFGIAFLPFAWLSFITQYTGREKAVHSRYIVLLLIESLITILLVWTNEFHGLIWSNSKFNTVGSLVVRISSHGAWYWFHCIYSHILFLIGTFLLSRKVLYQSPLPFHQTFILLLALFCPWIGNAMYNSRLNPFPGLDWTPFGFSITALCITFGVLRYRLLDITPIAYDTVFRSMDDAVIILDELDRVVDLNPSAQQIMGQSRGKWFGRSAEEVFSQWSHFIEKYGDTNNANSEITVNIDGVEHFLDLRISPLMGKGDQFQGRIVVLRDITERKKMQEDLLSEKQRMEIILNNIEDGYYEVDLPGNFIFFNDSLCRMLGYSRDEMMGMGNQQYTDQENRKKLFQAFNEVYRTGKPIQGFAWEVIRKDGAKVFGEVSVSLIRDSEGQPVGFRGIARDVTERKRAEEEIKQTLSLLNATLESTADGILVVDRGGKIESFNQKFVQMWRIPQSIILSHDDNQALAFVLDQLKDPEGFLAKVKELYTQSEAESFDLLEFKDGRCFERYSLPQRIGEQSVGRVWSFRDVTERKKADEELGRYRNHLEELVKERTTELEKSNKELTYMNQELEQFAYVASHDLQEPLRMVTSYVQLLKRRYKNKLDKDASEFIDFAVDGATRMHSLINDLLTYSRVGTRVKPFEPTNCETILQQSLDNLKITMEETGAVVTHDSLPTVMADNVQLGQLFQNLIGNAIKFRGNEPPYIHVSASRKGNAWVFSVRDNGIGIAPEYAERIFIIFQRLHGRDEYAGTGIGLAICKKIVERHGGRIWAESEVGKGATFYFTLPANKAELLSYSVSSGGRI